MQSMFPVKRAVLFQFQLALDIPPVFLGGIVFPLTLGTLQRDKFYSGLFGCHNLLLVCPEALRSKTL
jgi:hypothetical protein